ncbi:MAG: hypothetical protein ICV73_29605 [Acetobacteraceae bacterium]|nr:hypothetical protein [Acetobacteraceae bacterium]
MPIRYPYGDITSIRNGMDQLAADASFSARVSMAAWSLRMSGDDWTTGRSATATT